MRKELLFPDCFSFRFRYTLMCPFFPFLPKFFNIVDQLTNMVMGGKTNPLSEPKIKALRKYPIFGNLFGCALEEIFFGILLGCAWEGCGCKTGSTTQERNEGRMGWRPLFSLAIPS